jgi:biopolymer transport protein ExbB/TolQ
MAKPSIDRVPLGGFVLILKRARNMRAAKRRWTPSEQELLEEMIAARKTAAQIGLKLDRRADAVWARIHRLKLKSQLPVRTAISRGVEN